MVAGGGGRGGPPGVEGGPDGRGLGVDGLVLGLHRLDEPGRGSGPLEEQRPQHDVLTGVVHLEAGHAQAQVVGHDLRAAGVALGRAADEACDGGELPSEGAVDDDHLVDVGTLVGAGRGGHGGSSVWWAGLVRPAP